jgi:hypothetical protein
MSEPPPRVVVEADIPSWEVCVAVLREMHGLNQMQKIRVLGAVLAVVLAEGELHE